MNLTGDHTPCLFPTITRPHPTNTSPKIKNNIGSNEPSPVFGVSSNVWLPDVVPAYAPDEPELPDERTVVLLDEPPDEPLPDAEPELLEAEPELPDVLAEPEPLPELLPDELPEDSPRSMDVLPAPLSSTSSEASGSDVSSPTSTLTLPPAEEEEDVSVSSLLSEELPPSRLENA